MGRVPSHKKVARPVMQIYNIHICDPSDEKINQMLDYCQEFKLELLSYSVTDVSDVSPRWDTVAQFVFKNDRDAMIFKLKFK